jgi:SAM-dependent methyltransferase
MKYYERRRYNELYAETGNLNILNGYRRQDYRQIPDYHAVVSLLKTLPLPEIKTIIDIGCGNGLLLKYIRESLKKDLIPYGCDYNPLAIEVLKTQVFPELAENFTQRDVDTMTETIDQDVALLMHGDYTWNRLQITSPYLVLRIREHLADHPMDANRKQAILADNQRLAESKRLGLLATRNASYRHSFRLYQNRNNGEPFY